MKQGRPSPHRSSVHGWRGGSPWACLHDGGASGVVLGKTQQARHYGCACAHNTNSNDANLGDTNLGDTNLGDINLGDTDLGNTNLCDTESGDTDSGDMMGEGMQKCGLNDTGEG